MVLENPLEVLTQLNLSKNQAKIYLTLISNSPLNAVEISKAAALPKEVIYRQMPRLLEKGLVEKIVSIPSKFQATPLKNALENLLQQRSRQNSEIKKSVNRIIQKFSTNNKEKTSGQEQKMVLIPKGKRLEEFGKEKLLTTNFTLDTCVMGKRMMGWLIDYASKCSIQRISLMVSKDNYAINLYRQQGFQEYADKGEAFIMVREI